MKKARGVFVTGTDTGVGKTWAACSLLHALRAAGMRASGMKPVATGCTASPTELRNADAMALIAASDPAPAYADCNPFAFPDPVSPHIAAAEIDAEVTLAPIQNAYDNLAFATEVVVVEGVGGWLTPLSDRLRANAIPQTLGLPVILVVGLRLGCLSHAQLTARAIHTDGCELAGWIGNRVDPDMQRPKETLVTLHHALAVPCLGVIGHGVQPPSAAAALRDAADLIGALPG